MATFPSERPVNQLRQRMLDDTAMRTMRSRTQHDYVRHVRAFAAFLGRSPDTATAEDVRRFQFYQREHGAGEERANPAIAAAIAERMLAADRASEALAALDGASDGVRLGGHSPDWQRVRIEVLDALGRCDDAQGERWQVFERGLDAGYLRAHLKRLLDF